MNIKKTKERKMERKLLENLLKDITNKSDIEQTKVSYTFKKSIANIFDEESGDRKHLIKWLGAVCDKYPLQPLKGKDVVLGTIHNGVFYFNSYVNYKRIPIYFGKSFEKESASMQGSLTNYDIWDEPRTYGNHKTYKHLLGLLIYGYSKDVHHILIKFKKNIRIVTEKGHEEEKQNNYNMDHFHILDLSVFLDNKSIINELKTLGIAKDINSRSEWYKKCDNFIRKIESRGNSFQKIKKAINNFLKTFDGAPFNSGNTNGKYKMFVNIFRYLVKMSSDKNLLNEWPLVMYIPGLLSTKNRSGLVCGLNVSGEKDGNTTISKQELQDLAMQLSSRLSLCECIGHSLEMSFLERTGSLPGSKTEGRGAYQSNWFLTKKSTDLKGTGFTDEPSDREKMYKNMLSINSKTGNIAKMLKELLATMKELSDPGQREFSSYDTIAVRISDCIKKIIPHIFWQDVVKCDPINYTCPLVDLLGRLTKTEGDLRFLSAYREHFIHSFHTFTLGLAFMKDRLAKDQIKIASTNVVIETKDFMKIWFLTSMFHDVAYAIEKMEDLAEQYYFKVLLGYSKSDENNLFSFNKGALLIDKAIHNYLLDLAPLERMDHTLSRALVHKGDHGILSSFALYNTVTRFDGLKRSVNNICPNVAICFEKVNRVLAENAKGEKDKKNTIIGVVSRSIALHHSYDRHWIFSQNTLGAYENLPDALKSHKLSNALAMFLILCDSLSQSGRNFYPIAREDEMAEEEDNIYDLCLGNIQLPSTTPQSLHDILKSCGGDDIINGSGLSRKTLNKKACRVDLVYLPKQIEGKKGLGKRKIENAIAKDGKLDIDDEKKGGWYEKPRLMINQYIKLEDADKVIVTRIIVSNEGLSDSNIAAQNDKKYVYLFSLPI